MEAYQRSLAVRKSIQFNLGLRSGTYFSLQPGGGGEETARELGEGGGGEETARELGEGGGGRGGDC